MARRDAPADVAIVGMGAAGGVAAHVLTSAGLSVVGLEAGPAVSAGAMSLDEIRNDVRGWLSGPKVAGELPTWRADPLSDAVRTPWPALMVNAVGGASLHYDAVSFRFLPWHFKARSDTAARYGDSAIPPESTLADWPLGFEELEPFYDAAERAIGISGRAGNVNGRILPGGNPFEGPRAREYPMPPLRPSGWLEMLGDAARGLGWHPYPAPAAINSVEYDGRAGCTYCGFCKSNGCYRDAKGTTAVNVIPRAERTGLLRLETGARVTSIEVDDDGVVSGVRYVRGGEERLQPASAVLIGGYVYENTRLLLLSKSRAHPRGLANNRGQVGRHFTAHVMPCVYGLFDGRSLNRFHGSAGGQAICVDDWNGDGFDHAGAGFVGGSLLMALQQVKPIESATELLPPEVPRWGTDWKRWMSGSARSVGGLYAQIDSLTYEDHVIDLDPVATDGYGLPVARVTFGLRENERRASAFMSERMTEWLVAAGASRTWITRPYGIDGRHAFGGTRMGDDPESSVVDRYGFAHDVPNLGLLGASVFPTAGGHNPTLTVQAMAWRTAARLVDEWEAIARPCR